MEPIVKFYESGEGVWISIRTSPGNSIERKASEFDQCKFKSEYTDFVWESRKLAEQLKETREDK